MTDNVLLRMAGIGPGSPLEAVLERRANVVELTQKTYDAALAPEDPGGLSYQERAAFACRIAKLNDDEPFQRHFEELMEELNVSGDTARIADMWFDGGSDGRRAALIRHVDLVTHEPKNTGTADIEKLRAAGVSDADIVRLSELIAFLSYQIRVARGLRLMARLS